MARYIWRDDRFVDRNTGEPMAVPQGPIPKLAAVIGDLADYESPITGLPVRGRAERREEFKRYDCVEVDPRPKEKRYAKTEKWAKRLGLPLKGRDI